MYTGTAIIEKSIICGYFLDDMEWCMSIQYGSGHVINMVHICSPWRNLLRMPGVEPLDGMLVQEQHTRLPVRKARGRLQ